MATIDEEVEECRKALNHFSYEFEQTEEFADLNARGRSKVIDEWFERNYPSLSARGYMPTYEVYDCEDGITDGGWRIEPPL